MLLQLAVFFQKKVVCLLDLFTLLPDGETFHPVCVPSFLPRLFFLFLFLLFMVLSNS